MEAEEKITVILNTDSEKIAACARMMTQSDPWITLGMDYSHCLKAFDNLGPCKEMYVIEYQEKLAGFVILQLCGTFKGYIQTICISEDYRGKGLGKKLLRFCEEKIFKISPNIFLCVSSFNTGAIKLYEERGFTRIGELNDFVKQGFTELLLRKTIGPMI